MPRYLILVARDQPALSEYLTRNFAGDEKVQVVLDRRRGARRQRVTPHEPERRREAQRERRVDQNLHSRLVRIVRVEK